MHHLTAQSLKFTLPMCPAQPLHQLLHPRSTSEPPCETFNHLRPGGLTGQYMGMPEDVPDAPAGTPEPGEQHRAALRGMQHPRRGGRKLLSAPDLQD